MGLILNVPEKPYKLIYPFQIKFIVPKKMRFRLVAEIPGSQTTYFDFKRPGTGKM